MAGPDTREESVYAEFDVGNLCVYNVVKLTEENESNDNEDAWLDEIAKVGAQALIKKLWELPVETHGTASVIKLPQPLLSIPRAKPLPKPRPPTKWEQFVKQKNLKIQKKEKLVWDENSKEWRPRYGFHSIKNAENKSEWMVELPDNADPNVDYFAKKKEEKREAIAKNELQRLRNIAVIEKQKDPNADTLVKKKAGKQAAVAKNEQQRVRNIDAVEKQKVSSMESVDNANKEELLQRLSAAKAATASLGKFTKKLPKEKTPKNNTKKRKFAENIPQEMASEKERNMKLFEDMYSKKPKLDIQEAVQMNLMKKRIGAPGKASAKAGKKKQNKKQPKSSANKRKFGKRNRSQKHKKSSKK